MLHLLCLFHHVSVVVIVPISVENRIWGDRIGNCVWL
jgi:hypothetical protein